jgi:AcrR family transcriptional regulator
MEAPPPSRRARQREQTSQEIKDVGLRHVAEAGPGALSLRAIGREMGMTAGAIYSYFDDRQALLDALVEDVYADLAGVLEQAGAQPDPLRAVAYDYRAWAMANPTGYQLVYDSAAAATPRAPSPAQHRACIVLVRLTLHAPVDDDSAWTWDDFSPAFARALQAEVPESTPAATALALRLWGRLHGLVALEIHGHLATQLVDPAKLFDDAITELAASLEHSAA